ncbi:MULTISPECIES: enoyl-CoA hydratase/isomerase family protein [unclassified Microbacterium]|uniref:enoyl-CoA hydratase/isomerase family protein n=1 Tax=unclassified Microbacterium TaxID=2609290 RepID=UPI000DE2A12C|nr:MULTISPECIES: enoyl-CoA hydratase/isomerase family protein [unclassified Microbacterium]NYF28821.1 enoyl-CoA hydratase/carnithine racemase [Microbacterium sp. JAI119]RBO74335.1 enoyl-CoA hydratase/isomerase family protein [Microbacterium sp. H6]
MIDLTIADDVAMIVLDAPSKLNALDERALAELDAAYVEAEAAGVRALVLRGEGRAFCAGRDISGVDPRDDDVLGYLGGLVTPLLQRMSRFPAPTFAVAHGACLGVGLGLLIATDVVYVAESAKIGSPFAALGATLDSGGHALFLDRLGAHKTLDLIYTGRLMSGTEAVASGLFSRVFPDDEVVQATTDAAAAAARGATAAFLASKELLARIRDERLALWDAVGIENAAQAALCDTDDYREGFAAFQEKRRPEFRGR